MVCITIMWVTSLIPLIRWLCYYEMYLFLHDSQYRWFLLKLDKILQH
jgi:hypothetical protein